jgi:magnesium-protoporphyrin O-methyltransferase
VDGCCSSPGNDDVFTSATAASDARRVRRRGLLDRERRLLDPVVARGVDDVHVIEVGGGVGALQLALLDAGAARATNVELAPAYEDAAAALAEEAGVSDRVTRVVADATDPTLDVPSADVALLFRVVCCTEDWRGMLDTVVRARPRVIGLTFPDDSWTARLALRADAAYRWLSRTSFRMRLHPPVAMLGHLRRAGFSPVHDRAGPLWRTVVLVTAGPGGAERPRH